MLSYRHGYHAGNSADVFKHFVVERILTYLTQKDKPCFYLDTHAGAGVYSLRDELATKTEEYREGIARIIDATEFPPVIAPYLDCIQRCSEKFGEAAYPGSPWLAADRLRHCDRLILCELHPRDYPPLADLFAHDDRVNCYKENGFEKGLALMPPKERRGLIVIDPSYEIKEDYEGVVRFIQACYRRFATGVYALWYPVVDRQRIDVMIRRFKKAGFKNVQKFELQTGAECRGGMFASGMIVVNAPWTLAAEAEQALKWLSVKLALDDSAGYSIEAFSGDKPIDPAP
jgi:23S rRNA (adenine2030-N6)-methyltransferase